jgi:hypothetical protein
MVVINSIDITIITVGIFSIITIKIHKFHHHASRMAILTNNVSNHINRIIITISSRIITLSKTM